MFFFLFEHCMCVHVYTCVHVCVHRSLSRTMWREGQWRTAYFCQVFYLNNFLRHIIEVWSKVAALMSELVNLRSVHLKLWAQALMIWMLIEELGTGPFIPLHWPGTLRACVLPRKTRALIRQRSVIMAIRRLAFFSRALDNVKATQTHVTHFESDSSMRKLKLKNMTS